MAKVKQKAQQVKRFLSKSEKYTNVAHSLNSVGYTLEKVLRHIEDIDYCSDAIRGKLRYEEKICPELDDTVNAQIEEINSSIDEFSEHSKAFSSTIHSYAKELSTIINNDPDLLAAFQSLPSQNEEVSKGISQEYAVTYGEEDKEEVKVKVNGFVRFLEKHVPVVVFWRDPWKKKRRSIQEEIKKNF